MTVILVTGANKGIGYNIVKRLMAKESNQVILACRNVSLGESALKELGNPKNVEVLQLDVESDASVKAALEHVKAKHGQIDVLVNNAGMGLYAELTAEVAQTVVGVNYGGCRRVSEAFYPILKSGGRVISVCSTLGSLDPLSSELRDRFRSPTLTRDQIDELVNEYKEAITNKDYVAKGWPKAPEPWPEAISAYLMSKMAQVAYSRILSREWYKSKNITAITCCPGFCATDINNNTGTKSAWEGSEVAVWLADELSDSQAHKMNGGNYRENKPLEWFKDETPIDVA